jgi:hypothetical protein
VLDFDTESNAILRKWQFDKTYQDINLGNDGYHAGSNGNNDNTSTRDPIPQLLLLLSCISEVLSTTKSANGKYIKMHLNVQY